jgi:secreted PhoX family phosphatase
MDGTGYQFPRMGMASWENLVTNPKPGKNTVVLGNEDGSATNSHLHMYVGTKTTSGNAFEKAGLNNGKLYVLNVPAAATDNVFRTTIGKNKATPATFKEVNWNQSVSDFDKSVTEAGSEFARIEDGEWDPNNPNVFYFLTTESNKDPIATAPNPATPSVSRDGGALWRLTFKDAQNPLLGAELEMLLNGGESVYMSKPDNMAITKNGIVMIQEDPGNNDHVSRVLAYRIKDAKIATVAAFDSGYFAKGAAKLLTTDEESSGIIDVTSMMARKGDTNTYFLLNAQVHTNGVVAARPDLASRSTTTKTRLNNVAVEGGQFYLMTVSDWEAVFTK